MPRGAPHGNQYAQKAKSERGMTISLYLNAYDLEFLQAACQLAGEEPTKANARKRAKQLALEAIKADVRRTFANPALAKLLGETMKE